MKTAVRLACAAALALCAAWPHGGAAAAEPLQFRIPEGRVLNAFRQDGDVAAHLLLDSGLQPRILCAFPAGNSGVGVWFEPSAQPVQWTLQAMESARMEDARGRPLRGISAEASVAGGRLAVREAVLGSVRVLRDYQLGTEYPPETGSTPEIEGDTVRWARDRIDGAPGYSLALQVLEGELVHDDGDAIVLAPARPDAPIRLRITALTGERPLVPFAPSGLFAAAAGSAADQRPSLRSRQVLRFLAYHEKFLAGSWRFDTYFGRDTLISLRLLMPALRPEAIEAGLASVLERTNAQGEVAHEEDIGEFAVLRRRREQALEQALERAPADAPILDYGMIDDDRMLAPVAATYLLDTGPGRERAAAFLARGTGPGQPFGAALARNFAFVVDSARAFAREPVAANLVAIKPGRDTGQWRDSQDGLAGGRYPYDVNAVLMPAALDAIARFVRSGLLAPYLTPEQARELAAAGDLAAAWTERAPRLFDVAIEAGDARRRVAGHAGRQGVDPKPALAAVPREGLRFEALALDGGGRPIPVLHSDVGFALLFLDPEPSALDAMVASVMRPFPAGLMTGIGMLVANPAFAADAIGSTLGRNAYHGTVVWSWQQALMAAGLRRQLARDELPEATRTRVRQAQARLWRAIDATHASRTSELWSWSYADGQYELQPFGQGSGDDDESNAAQLWSTVYLAIPRPSP